MVSVYFTCTIFHLYNRITSINTARKTTKAFPQWNGKKIMQSKAVNYYSLNQINKQV